MLDPEILLVTLLTNAVRYFTIRQVARLLNLVDNPDAVSGILSRLQSRGLIGTCTVMSPPPVALEEPLLCWGVFDHESPNLKKLSRRLMVRELPDVRRIKCVFATKRTAHIFGGVAPDLSKPHQIGHDLQVSELVVNDRIDLRMWKTVWLPGDLEIPGYTDSPIIDDYLLHQLKGEDWLLANGFRRDRYLPDLAMIHSPGVIMTVVEYGGRYDPDRLLCIHNACAERRVNYQIW